MNRQWQITWAVLIAASLPLLSGCPEVSDGTQDAAKGQQANPAQRPTILKASHILITHNQSRSSTKAPRSKEEALALATQVATQARESGADFAELARTFSEGPTRDKGGDLGVFRPGQMVKAFDSALLSMGSGEISDPVETQFGYHVILRHEFVSAKHILVGYKGALKADASITRSKTEAQARAAEILEKLKAGAKFEDLAREFSDGPSSTGGGDLGMFYKGMMAPPFEKAAFACDVGGLTDVVETQFGFHVIHRYK